MREIFASNGDKGSYESSARLRAYTTSYPSKCVLPCQWRNLFLALAAFDFLVNITIQAEELKFNEAITQNLTDLFAIVIKTVWN
jgi:hypothetical protein